MTHASAIKGNHDFAVGEVAKQPEAPYYSDVNANEEDTDSEDDDRRLLILYASQTGSAQDVAEYIGREAWRRHFVARVQDVRDFDKVRLFHPFDGSYFMHEKLIACPHNLCLACTTGWIT